jgi:hypothetical protein
MNKRILELEPVYKESLSKNCTLVIFKNDWQLEYKADTFEEDKDLKYKVSSEKVDGFLFDLKRNLRLFFDVMESGAKTPPDIECLRDMILKFKTDQPGVYLTETFCIMTCQEDYDEIEAYVERAKFKWNNRENLKNAEEKMTSEE